MDVTRGGMGGAAVERAELARMIERHNVARREYQEARTAVVIAIAGYNEAARGMERSRDLYDESRAAVARVQRRQKWIMWPACAVALGFSLKGFGDDLGWWPAVWHWATTSGIDWRSVWP